MNLNRKMEKKIGHFCNNHKRHKSFKRNYLQPTVHYLITWLAIVALYVSPFKSSEEANLKKDCRFILGVQTNNFSCLTSKFLISFRFYFFLVVLDV